MKSLKMKSLKILALFLVIVITSIGLSACGGNSKKPAEKPAEKPAAQSQSNTDTNEKEEEPVENTSENTPESTAEKLKAVLSIGYVGVDNHDTTVYWAVSADVDFGVLLAVSADESQKISFVGDITSNGTELTITDAKTGNSRTVDVQEYTHEGKKGIQLTDKEGDVTFLLPVEVDKVIDAMLAAEAK